MGGGPKHDFLSRSLANHSLWAKVALPLVVVVVVVAVVVARKLNCYIFKGLKTKSQGKNNIS